MGSQKGTKTTNHYLGQLIRMQEEIGTGGSDLFTGAFLQEAAVILKNDELRELSKKLQQLVIFGEILRWILQECTKTGTPKAIFITNYQNQCFILQIWKKLFIKN
jgi:hypothetical protein